MVRQGEILKPQRLGDCAKRLAELIGVGKVSETWGFEWGTAVIFFPVNYFFGDVITEVYGYARSRRVLWTGFGALLLLSSWASLVGALAFVLCFLMTRTGSLSSITGLVVAMAVHLVVYPVGAHLWPGVALIFVILLRHGANLDALLENRENRF